MILCFSCTNEGREAVDTDTQQTYPCLDIGEEPMGLMVWLIVKTIKIDFKKYFCLSNAIRKVWPIEDSSIDTLPNLYNPSYKHLR